jgi:hypothetical protein
MLENTAQEEWGGQWLNKGRREEERCSGSKCLWHKSHVSAKSFLDSFSSLFSFLPPW